MSSSMSATLAEIKVRNLPISTIKDNNDPLDKSHCNAGTSIVLLRTSDQEVSGIVIYKNIYYVVK